MAPRPLRRSPRNKPAGFKQDLPYRVRKPVRSGPKKGIEIEEDQHPELQYAQVNGLTGEDLFNNLKKSYVGSAPSPPRPKLGKRQHRWQHRGPTPIDNLENVPLGWNSKEPDLDPKDLDAQIARCNERIADGIMPSIFEWKLKGFMDEKQKQDAMKAAEPNISDWNVVYRLNTLRSLLASLEKEGDVYQEIPNVKAIIVAYRSGNLGWNHGLVTYFSHGQQISQPRRFIYEEFVQISSQYKGHTGFWVEGIFALEPQPQALYHTSTDPLDRTAGDFAYLMKMSLKVPFSSEHAFMEWPFMDDTGASMMQVATGDIDLLTILAGYAPATLGYNSVVLADGSSFHLRVVYLDVNMHRYTPSLDATTGAPILDPNGVPMFDELTIFEWGPVQCGVINNTNIPRLNGPWLRQKMYTATAPAPEIILHIFDKKSAFQPNVPVRDGRPAILPLVTLVANPPVPGGAGAGAGGTGAGAGGAGAGAGGAGTGAGGSGAGGAGAGGAGGGAGGAGGGAGGAGAGAGAGGAGP